MKFLLERSSTILAIILILIVIFTKNLAEISTPIPPDNKPLKIGNLGLFKFCVTDEAAKDPENPLKANCVSYSDPSFKKIIDIDQGTKITQILVIIGLLFLFGSMICEYIPGCVSKKYAPSMILLGSLFLIASIIVFYTQVVKKVKKGIKDPLQDKDLKFNASYQYSLYFLIAGALISFIGGVSGFMESRK
jgi:hypothetical protein